MVVERVLSLGDHGPDVVELQRMLRCLGLPIPAVSSGEFDGHTDAAVRAFQSADFVKTDGRVGSKTRAVLHAEVTAQSMPELREYRGGFGFLLLEEGHRGYPYWPESAASGVTLDPGFDLGHQSEDRMHECYGHSLRTGEMMALATAIGARGAAAGELARTPAIARVRIARDDAAKALPRIAADFWREATTACPALTRHSTPAAVHTAILSLAYHAGSGAVKPLRSAITEGAWARTAEVLANMHAGRHAHARRQREAALIMATAEKLRGRNARR